MTYLNKKQVSELKYLVVYTEYTYASENTLFAVFRDSERAASFALVNGGRVFEIGAELNASASLYGRVDNDE
jgi:hypothetical protein